LLFKIYCNSFFHYRKRIFLVELNVLLLIKKNKGVYLILSLIFGGIDSKFFENIIFTTKI